MAWYTENEEIWNTVLFQPTWIPEMDLRGGAVTFRSTRSVRSIGKSLT